MSLDPRPFERCMQRTGRGDAREAWLVIVIGCVVGLIGAYALFH